MKGGGALVPAALLLATMANAEVQGLDAAACRSGTVPAILVTIEGLKDRKGGIKLELYPATEEDFLRDDRDLRRAGRFFRRIYVPAPQTDQPVDLCIRAPEPGRYALLVTHDRDMRNKFNFFADGAGFPSNRKLGMARPRLSGAVVDVPAGVVPVTVRMQYLRGLSGFGPVGR